eukprot:6187603-Pleurochrysis_carterae.AAC.3
MLCAFAHVPAHGRWCAPVRVCMRVRVRMQLEASTTCKARRRALPQLNTCVCSRELSVMLLQLARKRAAH